MRLDTRMGEHFELRWGLRQECVMSPWVFNFFFEKVVRQMNERAKGKGVKLRDENGRGGWEIKQVLYANDTVLVAETRENPHHIVSEFERACDSMGLKTNVGKSKVLTIKKDQMGSCEMVRVNGEELYEVDKFNYLGVMISTDRDMGEEMGHRMFVGRKVWGRDGKVFEGNYDIQRIKTGVFYCSETWSVHRRREK